LNAETAAYALFAVAVGGLFPMQAAANALLARGVGGPIAATIISILSSLVFLLCVNAVIFRQWPSLAALSAVPKPLLWLGGTLGAIFLSANVFLAPRLGAAATLCLVIAGQLLSALAIDRFGLFGFALRDVSAGRLGGVLLVLVGAIMVRLT
jgi:bacterial/archaeal transporter family-2 protein